MILVVAILGTGIVFLDQTAVNVAIPSIQSDLQGDIGDLQWIIDSYLLTLSVTLLIGGALGDLYGRVRVYNAGMLLFLVASVACGLAPTSGWLIAARALQGVGGGIMVPGALAIINASTAPERRGRVLGTWATFSPLITLAGPIVGGFLVDNVSWRAIFFLNIPLGIVAMLVAVRHVPDSRNEEAGGRLDWAGLIALVLGLGGLLFALIEGPRLGWTDPLVVATLLIGILGLATFVIVESRVPAPLVPLHHFRNRTFSGINLMTLILFAGLGGPFFFLTLNLQQVQGYSASAAGLAIIPIALSIFLLSRPVGRLSDRIGPRPILITGVLLMSAGFLLLLRPALDASYWSAWFPAILVYGIGIACMVVPLTTIALGALPQRNSGIASGVNNSASRIGQMLSVAILGAVLAGGFRSSLVRRGQELGLPQGVLDALFEQARNLGATQAPVGLPADIAAAVEQLIRLSFVDAFRLIMLLSAAFVLTSLVVLLLMVRPEAQSEEAPSLAARELL
jgi:EmrB/QacA subfamily drug resistance transporter